MRNNARYTRLAFELRPAHAEARLNVFYPTFSDSIRPAIARRASASTAALAWALVAP